MHQRPTLIWNTARSAWEIPNTENLLCQHLELFSETFISSGMMRNGQVFELPMQEHRTHDSEFSSSLGEDRMLRTPSVTDSTGGAISEKQARERNRMVKTADQVAELAHHNGWKVSKSITDSLTPDVPKRYECPCGQVLHINMKPSEDPDIECDHCEGIMERIDVQSLFPTPTVQDGKNNGGPSQHDRNTKPLNVEATLLPTTTASDWKGANHSASGSASSRSISTVVEQTNWGRFSDAITRWESVIGRKAPPPTKPDGKDNSHRLSSKFTEWMMGLPDGWITSVGLSRSSEIKACGNGVVPQQAELALRILLDMDYYSAKPFDAHLPTPTVTDTYTGNLSSKQTKEGSMHSMSLPRFINTLSRWIDER